ncbi:MAG TPA: YbhB/YbcL family Raf kinase inhibitor-like protein [Candidatus Paceibacterota bacterium]|nr:YbhB/YbcL family Raf kinase inhibitor-like protein [Candidatus Paceibacterota bacterium]
MIITSPSFEDGTKIPAKFTCSGGNINPELGIQNVPENTKALALIVDDPDAPSGTFTHWSVWNIDPGTTVIKEESVPPGSVEGTNSYGHTGWRGPCPQVPGPAHHYHFKLYALDATLNNGSGAIPAEVEAEIAKHAIAKAELIGIYP